MINFFKKIDKNMVWIDKYTFAIKILWIIYSMH
jgi:hypothetical protein